MSSEAAEFLQIMHLFASQGLAALDRSQVERRAREHEAAETFERLVRNSLEKLEEMAVQGAVVESKRSYRE